MNCNPSPPTTARPQNLELLSATQSCMHGIRQVQLCSPHCECTAKGCAKQFLLPRGMYVVTKPQRTSAVAFSNLEEQSGNSEVEHKSSSEQMRNDA